MTERSNGRSLPPLSPRALPKEPSDSEPERPKAKKKKVKGQQSDTETPRRRQRRLSTTEEGDGKKRKKNTFSANGDVQSNGHVDTMDDESTTNADTNSVSTVSKTKRKEKKDIGTSRETLTGPTENEEKPRPKKKRKKKKPESQVTSDDVPDYDLGLAGELAQIKDDVVDFDEERDDHESLHIAAPTIRSEPLGTVFIEKKNGFKAADKVKLARRMEEAQQKLRQLPPEPPSRTTIQFGLSTHRVFKTFTLFCHGLFAGLAFWHIVMVFTMINTIGTEGFLSYYYTLAQPVQSLYFLLFVFCTVSTFDRYDLSCVSKRFVVRALTLQNGAVSCVFYFIGLVFSLAIAAIDDKISLFKMFPLLWADPLVATAELNTWRNLNAVRGVTSIMGWFVIALRPNTDRLIKNLQKADENAIGDELHMARQSAA